MLTNSDLGDDIHLSVLANWEAWQAKASRANQKKYTNFSASGEKKKLKTNQMKKYRLTKITVKTKEIVALSKNAAGETQLLVCPFCHHALPTALVAAENPAAEINANDPHSNKLLPAQVSGDQLNTK